MKVGDYVRTNNGIGKITKYKYVPEYENCHVIWLDNNDYAIRYRDGEIKSSHNIIDLIEVGDYVNGQLVHKNDEDNYLYLIGIDGDGNYYEESLKDIKSIVTHEQFSQMEYKVGEKNE